MSRLVWMGRETLLLCFKLSPSKTATYSKTHIRPHFNLSKPDLRFLPLLCGWNKRLPVWLLFKAPGSSGVCLCCFCLLRWVLCCVGSDSLLTSNSSSPPPLSCQLAAPSRSPTVHHHRNLRSICMAAPPLHPPAHQPKSEAHNTYSTGGDGR